MTRTFEITPKEGWEMRREWRFGQHDGDWKYVGVATNEAKGHVGFWCLTNEDVDEPSERDGTEPLPAAPMEIDLLLAFLDVPNTTAEEIRAVVRGLQAQLERK